MATASLTWLGHASFRLDSPNGKRVYVDPWLDNPKCPESERDPERCDVIAVTHGHSDHLGSVVAITEKVGPVPIVALTPDETTRRRLSLVWGITAVTVPWFADTDALLAGFRGPVGATGLVAAGAPVIVTGGWPFGETAATNLLHVATL